MKPLMRRLIHQRYAVEITNSLYVGKDAGTNHQCQHVYGNEECCANGECDKHSDRNLCVVVELNFHHRHLITEQFRSRIQLWSNSVNNEK